MGVPPSLPQDFPIYQLPLPSGWWRFHRPEHNPWWFSSDGSGRFDLESPEGTCYVAYTGEGAFIEVFRVRGVSHVVEQIKRKERVVSVMQLGTWIGRIADFTSPKAAVYGVTPVISTGPHPRARPWAFAARNGGFGGIAYWLSQDPGREEVGLALFGREGCNPPAGAPSPTPSEAPVRLANNAATKFGGKRSGLKLKAR
jgi:hypothetical protein